MHIATKNNLTPGNKYRFLKLGELYNLTFKKGGGIHSISIDSEHEALKASVHTQPMELLYLGKVQVKWKYWTTKRFMHKFLYKNTFYCFRIEDIINTAGVELIKLS